MLITGICGSHKRVERSHSHYFLDHAKGLAAKSDTDFRVLNLNKRNILPCTGCGMCRDQGVCQHDANESDEMKHVLAQLCESDGFVVCSPTYSQGVTSLLIKFIHRCCTLGEQLKKNPFYDKPLLNIVLSGGIGNATALYDFECYQPFLKYKSCGTLGLSLLSSDSEMKDMSDFVDPLDSPGLKLLVESSILKLFNRSRHS